MADLRRFVRISIAAAGVAACMVLAVSPAYAAEQAVTISASTVTSSTGLVEHPKDFDSKTVVFEGEAVGEVMRRGDYAWLHLNDDVYGIQPVDEGGELSGFNSGMPVWAPAVEAEKVGVYGDYKHRGDMVRVTGRFNAACAQHGGDMDIHAETAEVINAGARIEHTIPGLELAAAVALSLLAGALFVAERKGRRVRMM